MFDSLPVESYKENLEAILDNKPLVYGNMKGQILNKQKFINDLNDFDLILRKHVPSKYSKYFYSPNNTKKFKFNDDDDEQDDDKDDTNTHSNDIDSIELTRSIPVPSYNLSPVKKQPSSALKDSQKLMSDLFSKDRKQYRQNTKPNTSVRFNNDSDDPSLLLDEPSYVPIKNSPISSTINSAKFTIEELKSLKLENKQLLKMIHSLQSELSISNQTNEDLKIEVKELTLTKQHMNQQIQEQQTQIKLQQEKQKTQQINTNPQYLDELIELQSTHDKLKKFTKEIQFKLKFKVEECKKLQIQLSKLNLTTDTIPQQNYLQNNLQNQLDSIDSQLNDLNKKKLELINQKQKQKQNQMKTSSTDGVTNIQNYFNISETTAKKLIDDLIDPAKLQELLDKLNTNDIDIDIDTSTVPVVSLPSKNRIQFNHNQSQNFPKESNPKVTHSHSQSRRATPDFIKKQCEICTTQASTTSQTLNNIEEKNLTSLISKIGNSQKHDLETIKLLDILSKNNNDRSNDINGVWG